MEQESAPTMTVSSLLLGLLHIAIVVAVLLLIGAVVRWLCSYVGLAIPDIVIKLYIIVIVLVAIYMLVALMLGLPSLA